MLIGLLLGCLLTPVPQELRVDYCRATLAWYPAIAQVKAVEYCDSEWECAEQGVFGGGGYGFNNHIITIDRSYRFPADGVFLTLAHEYGHALGLGHVESHQSIMQSGWEPPLAPGPSAMDFENLKKLLDNTSKVQ